MLFYATVLNVFKAKSHYNSIGTECDDIFDHALIYEVDL